MARPKYANRLVKGPLGWPLLSQLRDGCPRVRSLDVARKDLLHIWPEVDARQKLGVDTCLHSDSDIWIRAVLGKSFGSVRTDQTLCFSPSPGYLRHCASIDAMTSTSHDGIRCVGRNGVHLLPCLFDQRQGNYFTNRKAPYALVIDASLAAYDDHHSSSSHPMVRYFATETSRAKPMGPSRIDSSRLCIAMMSLQAILNGALIFDD